METFSKSIVFRIKDKAIFEVPLFEEILIGSNDTCDFCVPNVASEQCKIKVVEDRIIICSLTEEKRTIVNGISLMPNSEVNFNGGKLTLGTFDFVVEVRNLSLGIKRIKTCTKCEYINGETATICRKCGGSIALVPANELVVNDSINIEEPTQKIDENKKAFNPYLIIGIAVAAVILLGVIIGVIVNRPQDDIEEIIESETSMIAEETEPAIEVINLENVTISGVDNQLYTSAPVYCSFEVSYGDVVLTEGVDYTCVYENNIGLGTATITINGNGETTTGSSVRTFTIVTGDSTCDDENNRGVLDFVVRIYTSALNRYPEPAILVSYANQLINQEITGSNLVNIVYNSEEFTNRNLSDEDFLTSVYLGLLNRNPDEVGFNSNITLLSNGMSRSDFINNIAASAEFESVCGSIGIVSSIEPEVVEVVVQPEDTFVPRTFTAAEITRIVANHYNEYFQTDVMVAFDQETVSWEDTGYIVVIRSCGNPNYANVLYSYVYCDVDSNVAWDEFDHRFNLY